jgi:hypothetical protein
MLTGRNHSTIRTKSDVGIERFFTLKQNENDKEIVNRVCEIADKHGVSPTQVIHKNRLGRSLRYLLINICIKIGRSCLDAWQTTCHGSSRRHWKRRTFIRNDIFFIFKAF